MYSLLASLLLFQIHRSYGAKLDLRDYRARNDIPTIDRGQNLQSMLAYSSSGTFLLFGSLTLNCDRSTLFYQNDFSSDVSAIHDFSALCSENSPSDVRESIPLSFSTVYLMSQCNHSESTSETSKSHPNASPTLLQSVTSKSGHYAFSTPISCADEVFTISGTILPSRTSMTPNSQLYYLLKNNYNLYFARSFRLNLPSGTSAVQYGSSSSLRKNLKDGEIKEGHKTSLISVKHSIEIDFSRTQLLPTRLQRSMGGRVSRRYATVGANNRFQEPDDSCGYCWSDGEVCILAKYTTSGNRSLYSRSNPCGCVIQNDIDKKSLEVEPPVSKVHLIVQLILADDLSLQISAVCAVMLLLYVILWAIRLRSLSNRVVNSMDTLAQKSTFEVDNVLNEPPKPSSPHRARTPLDTSDIALPPFPQIRAFSNPLSPGANISETSGDSSLSGDSVSQDERKVGMELFSSSVVEEQNNEPEMSLFSNSLFTSPVLRRLSTETTSNRPMGGSIGRQREILVGSTRNIHQPVSIESKSPRSSYLPEKLSRSSLFNELSTTSVPRAGGIALKDGDHRQNIDVSKNFVTSVNSFFL